VLLLITDRNRKRREKREREGMGERGRWGKVR
jgi:hypothetical protein